MLPPLVADVDIAAPVVHFLRSHGVDILSAREEGWGAITDSQILARAHAVGRFVLTHEADFGMLAAHRGEPITGWTWPHDCAHMWGGISPPPSHGFEGQEKPC